ncbi:hypothetical protein PHYBLDRAFT_79069 [Phycomyces blakesleeanus NRRL 1555(-)]|uniref:Uncharacterized protein n=1 Tax=Phycomyces blakesleeanus (strain ATCC 8743b / DSM 1359 / FGSC 10004 / NBRC 33097 / NRRL 1555) TaxID=763407 RepID=A0A162NBW8_PHYB8|nr:hypothetical protein PHYBLDRAFT_79069 [Phycomyces blakesleeanus NRRL 1555(-)]OAD67814.1 hypothetical protein PHYBLDRAFT_79069 [Phycomyces blakesleeanus NRRL 1555(-)]|eukprot:XP_018285854.1 hypothetical protein PHYBLDRAFT_79069 [Phycomyces blakesleeanus NRRL 1555(-)]
MNPTSIIPRSIVSKQVARMAISSPGVCSSSATQCIKRHFVKDSGEQPSTSGTTEEIKNTDTAFDSTVDPKKEIKKMDKETDKPGSPLERSGANEKATPTTSRKQ